MLVQPRAGGYSAYCGRSLAISCPGAFEADEDVVRCPNARIARETE